MKRTMRILTVAALSSVYVMQGVCTFQSVAPDGAGMSIIPTVTNLLANIPYIGNTLANLRP